VRTAGEGQVDGPRWQTIKDVDWVIGNGYLWRRAALERTGLLDERLFGYHEDVDWCLRARAAGFRVVYAGTAAIIHKGGSSSQAGHRHRFPTWYFLGRNGVLVVRKHGRWYEQARFALLCGAALAARWLRALLLRLAPSAAIRAAGVNSWSMEAAFARGMLDGLCNRPIPFARLGLASAAPAGP